MCVSSTYTHTSTPVRLLGGEKRNLHEARPQAHGGSRDRLAFGHELGQGAFGSSQGRAAFWVLLLKGSWRGPGGPESGDQQHRPEAPKVLHAHHTSQNMGLLSQGQMTTPQCKHSVLREDDCRPGDQSYVSDLPSCRPWWKQSCVLDSTADWCCQDRRPAHCEVDREFSTSSNLQHRPSAAHSVWVRES